MVDMDNNRLQKSLRRISDLLQLTCLKKGLENIESESLNMDFDANDFLPQARGQRQMHMHKFHISNGLGPGWTETP